jgi:hypothetical protein
VFEHCLTAEKYLNFLEDHLLELLEDVLCEVSGLKVTELAGEDHKPGHQGCKISQPLDCFGVI